MNKRVVRFLALCLLVVPPFAGCRSVEQTLIPVTGADVVPAQIELARDNVLEYVISSSRLANSPPSANWQLDVEEQLEGEYHFRSGNWLMVIWLADADEENRRVIIFNQAENAFWCGYVAPDGHVVDTTYMR